MIVAHHAQDHSAEGHAYLAEILLLNINIAALESMVLAIHVLLWWLAGWHVWHLHICDDLTAAACDAIVPSSAAVPCWFLAYFIQYRPYSGTVGILKVLKLPTG